MFARLEFIRFFLRIVPAKKARKDAQEKIRALPFFFFSRPFRALSRANFLFQLKQFLYRSVMIRNRNFQFFTYFFSNLKNGLYCSYF